MRAKIETEEE